MLNCQLKMENFSASVGVAARAKFVTNWRQAKAKFLAPKHVLYGFTYLEVETKETRLHPFVRATGFCLQAYRFLIIRSGLSDARFLSIYW